MLYVVVILTKHKEIKLSTTEDKQILSFPNKRITTQEAADFLGVTKGTLEVWRSQGRYNIPYIKIGSKVRYRMSDLVAFIEERVTNKYEDKEEAD